MRPEGRSLVRVQLAFGSTHFWECQTSCVFGSILMSTFHFSKERKQTEVRNQNFTNYSRARSEPISQKEPKANRKQTEPWLMNVHHYIFRRRRHFWRTLQITPLHLLSCIQGHGHALSKYRLLGHHLHITEDIGYYDYLGTIHKV